MTLGEMMSIQRGLWLMVLALDWGQVGTQVWIHISNSIQIQSMSQSASFPDQMYMYYQFCVLWFLIISIFTKIHFDVCLWNQNQTSVFSQARKWLFWHFWGLWILNFGKISAPQELQKFTKFTLPDLKNVKIAILEPVFALVESTKLISHKIWVVQKIVKFLLIKLISRKNL